MNEIKEAVSKYCYENNTGWISIKENKRVVRLHFGMNQYHRPFFYKTNNFISFWVYTYNVHTGSEMIGADFLTGMTKPYYKALFSDSHYLDRTKWLSTCSVNRIIPFSYINDYNAFWWKLKPVDTKQVILLLWMLKYVKPQLSVELNYMILIHFFLHI